MKAQCIVCLAIMSIMAPMALGAEDINVSPLVYDFGNVEVGSSATITITIANTGDSSIAVNDISFQAGSDSAFAITSAPYLPVFFGSGGVKDVNVTFTPLEWKEYSAVLEIRSSDPDEPMVEVILSGSGGFPSPAEQIQYILDFIDDSVNNGNLSGSGPGKSAEGRFKAFVNMLESIDGFIEDENFFQAYQQLDGTYNRTDGQKSPPDFVSGDAASELAELILTLMESIDSEYPGSN